MKVSSKKLKKSFQDFFDKFPLKYNNYHSVLYMKSVPNVPSNKEMLAQMLTCLKIKSIAIDTLYG